jgi:hypothetical protein
MISSLRMKIDILGQSLMLTAVVILAIIQSHTNITNTMLIVLAIWQMASALHLYFSYHYVLKINFIKTVLVMSISTPVWIHLLGAYAYLPVGGLLMWYFIQTIKDTALVLRRPKSFWDL